MRFRLCHAPARLAHHVRRRHLRIERTWTWANAFAASWTGLTRFPFAT